MLPTIVLDVTDEMRIMQEEIFALVLRFNELNPSKPPLTM